MTSFFLPFSKRKLGLLWFDHNVFFLNKFNHVESQHGGRRRLTVIISATIAAISGMLLVGCYYIHKIRRKMTGKFTYSYFQGFNVVCFSIERWWLSRLKIPLQAQAQAVIELSVLQKILPAQKTNKQIIYLCSISLIIYRTSPSSSCCKLRAYNAQETKITWT